MTCIYPNRKLYVLSTVLNHIIMSNKAGNIFTYLAALIPLVLGVIYFLRRFFLPYHEQAMDISWSDVDSNTRFLILALMKVVAGGYLAIALVLIVLQKKFSTSRISWIPMLILIVGILVGGASLYATLIVRLNSPGKPPIFFAIVGILLVVLGYVFNKRTLDH